MELLALTVIAAIAAVVLLVVLRPVRLVQQYEKMVVFRFGRPQSVVREPGLRFIIPILDQPVKVDVRERVVEIPSQTARTRDGVLVKVGLLVYCRITDPLKSLLNVANFTGALQGVASKLLRPAIAEFPEHEVLWKAEGIGEVLRVRLDDVTERWGGRVTQVELVGVATLAGEADETANLAKAIVDLGSDQEPVERAWSSFRRNRTLGDEVEPLARLAFGAGYASAIEHVGAIVEGRAIVD